MGPSVPSPHLRQQQPAPLVSTPACRSKARYTNVSARPRNRPLGQSNGRASHSGRARLPPSHSPGTHDPHDSPGRLDLQLCRAQAVTDPTRRGHARRRFLHVPRNLNGNPSRYLVKQYVRNRAIPVNTATWLDAGSSRRCRRLPACREGRRLPPAAVAGFAMGL